MGLFDFFTGKGGGVSRTVAKATNKTAQSIDRFKALEALRDEGSPDAIAGLLKRFTFNYDKSIEDEQEKEFAHDALVELGRADKRMTVLAALEESLVQSETIAWQLKVLSDVATDHDEAWPIVEKVVAANDNEYVRDPSRKIQLVDFLGEWKDKRAAEALLQYLEDVDDNVRFHAVEALVHQKDEEVAREPMLKALLRPGEESRRLQIRILDALVELGWNTHGHKGEVDELIGKLQSGHSIDGKGRIKK